MDLTKRKVGLDVLRSLAILIVVYVHGGALFPNDEIKFPWIPLPDGVALFFVLSGFLIGSIIYKDFVTKEKSGITDIFRFYKRRWFRTLPNYYLFLGINFLIAYVGLTSQDPATFTWKFLFFLQNFYHGFTGPFLESWSLSVEEWFYLLFPLILVLAFYILPRKFAFLGSAILFIVFSFSLRIARQYWQAPLEEYWYHIEIIKTVVNRFDAIGWGILAAFFTSVFTINIKFSRILFGLALLVFVAKLFLWNIPHTPFWNSVNFTVEPFIVMFMLPYLSTAQFPKNIISRFFSWISKISYSLYLIHLGVVIALIQHNIAVTPTNAYWIYALYWGSSLLASTFIYRFFEKPITGLRDRY